MQFTSRTKGPPRPAHKDINDHTPPRVLSLKSILCAKFWWFIVQINSVQATTYIEVAICREALSFSYTSGLFSYYSINVNGYGCKCKQKIFLLAGYNTDKKKGGSPEPPESISSLPWPSDLPSSARTLRDL